MYSSCTPKKGFHLFPQPAIAWMAILGFISFSGLCLVPGTGRIFNFAFPALALAVGVFLYLRYSILYMGFTWWMWFLTPLVRRLSDYRSGFHDPSPILLAPYLVTLVSIATLIRYIPKLRRQGGLPFILSLVGVFYGFLVGLIKSSPVSVSVSLLEWLSPVIFSCYIFVNWRDYLRYRQNTQRIFLWCALVTGIYGIIQYLVAPEWDRSWLLNTQLLSAGTPEPLGIRVWSTMHGPAVFAYVMMACLLLLLSSVGSLSIPAIIFGYLSFLLSLVRSAWLGWFIGLLTLVTTLKQSLQIRLILIVSVVLACIIPLTTVEPFAAVIHTRLQTLSDPANDGSGVARQSTYGILLSYALTNFLGDGLGDKSALFDSAMDSAILDILISLGWLGTIFYVGGLILLLFELFQDSYLSFDLFANNTRAITLGMVIQIPLGSVMVGLPGMVLWGFLGLGLAAAKYYHYQSINNQI